jgi:hypothetical protein
MKQTYKILQREIHYTYWVVDAESEEEALDLLDAGEADFLDEADYIDHDGEPEIVEVYPAED